MNSDEKKAAIKQHVIDMLEDSKERMISKIDRIFSSGVLDVDNWSEKNMPMVQPKIICRALLLDEGRQYDAKGTSFAKQINREVEAIRLIL